MWMTVFVLGTMCPAGVAAPLTDEVADAIQRYQRPWQPAPDALTGLVVRVQPAIAEAKGVANDLAILTSGYVEQLVKRGGGTIAPQAVCPADAVDLTVSYHAGSTDEVEFVCETGGGNAWILTNVVTRAWGQSVPAGANLDGAKAEAPERAAAKCAIKLPLEPGASFTRETLRQRARDDATRIVRSLVEYRARVIKDQAPPESDAIRRLRRVVNQLCPDAHLPPERADWFCRMFAKVAISNASLTLFQPHATLDGETVVVRGRTTAPSAVRGLLAALRLVGIQPLRNEMRVLPDEGRLGDERFGACIATAIITRSQPTEASGEQTELLYGEPVYLLDRDKDHYLLLAGDGYWGWARREAILPMTEATFSKYLKHPRGLVADTIELEQTQIPRGALVAFEPVGDKRDEADGSAVALILPDGTRKRVSAAKVRDLRAERARAARQRARAALALLYVPYKFGGRSPLGTDCSGLVGDALRMSGIAPARDAWQLAFFGKLSATRWYRADLRAGDIVFFIDDRGTIYHTGVAIDATHIVDASPPAVQIGSIVPGDRLYDERMDRDFFIAKRP